MKRRERFRGRVRLPWYLKAVEVEQCEQGSVVTCEWKRLPALVRAAVHALFRRKHHVR